MGQLLAGRQDRLLDQRLVNANGPAFGGASSIIISRSTDGGNHWHTPVDGAAGHVDHGSERQGVGDRRPAVAIPMEAYAVWDRLVSPSTHANPTAFLVSPAFRGPAMFSKTTDGGVTWSTGRSSSIRARRTRRSATRSSCRRPARRAGQLIDGFDHSSRRAARATTSVARSAWRSSAPPMGGTRGRARRSSAPEQVGSVSIIGHSFRTSDELPEFKAGPENGNPLPLAGQSRSARAALEDRVLDVDRRR